MKFFDGLLILIFMAANDCIKKARAAMAMISFTAMVDDGSNFKMPKKSL
jgi:hypothetical protein